MTRKEKRVIAINLQDRISYNKRRKVPPGYGCPFVGRIGCKIYCGALFPSIKDIVRPGDCPCAILSRPYVVRRSRRLVKEVLGD